MRVITTILLPTLLVTSLSVVAQISPQEHIVKDSQPGKVTHTATVRASVVVTDIDKATRKLTLKNAAGQLSEMIAGDDVRNFAQIQVGDQVNVEYVKSMTLELKKHGTAEPSSGGIVDRAPLGNKPGGIVAHQVTIVADVTDVNPGNKTITLKGPKGNIVELDVTNPDQFKVVKVGDQVEVTYAEAMAIAVTPAPKSATE